MAGLTNSPFSGGPLILRDGQAASRNFKVSSQVSGVWKNVALIPKPKFLFFVEFVVPDIAPVTGAGTRQATTLSDSVRLSDTKEGIVFQVKQIDKPRFNIRTETLVQYNKKRVIQTRVDYQPMTIDFHDDVGDRVLNFWAKYFEFYYGDGNQLSSADWREDVVSSDFDEGAGGGWGYLGRFFRDIANAEHFLEQISLYEFYGGEFTKMSFVHPKITVFDHDANNYADGTTGQGIRMTFDYEGVVYDLERRSLEDNPELIDKFGFLSQYRDIDDSTPAEGELADFIRRTIRGVTDDIADPARVPNIGVDNLSASVNAQAQAQAVAGGSALGGSGFSFGSDAFAGVSGRSTDLKTLTSLSGNAPSSDLVEKQTGITNTVDNLGQYRPRGSRITTIQSSPNRGISPNSVTAAASQLKTSAQGSEITIAPGQTRLATSQELDEFSRTYGTIAAVAQNEGIVSGTSNKIATINDNNANGTTFVDSFGDGSYVLTDRGAAVVNTTRSSNSYLGTRRARSSFTADDVDVDQTGRLLGAERDTGFST